MFKKSIVFSLTYFVVSTLWQIIANGEIRWIDNFMICFFIFLILMVYEWSKKPYNWKKDKQ